VSDAGAELLVVADLRVRVLRDPRGATVKRSAWVLAFLAACGGARGGSPSAVSDADVNDLRSDGAPNASGADAESDGGPPVTCYQPPTAVLQETQCVAGLNLYDCASIVGPGAYLVQACPDPPEWLLGCCILPRASPQDGLGTENCTYWFQAGPTYDYPSLIVQQLQQQCTTSDGGTWGPPVSGDAGEDDAGESD
jgi:hypothetical protein